VANLFRQRRIVNGEPPILVRETRKAEIEDYISRKMVLATPEEQVRQIMVRKLVEEYGYSPKQIQTVPELFITKGSKRIGAADIVVFHDDQKSPDNIYIIVETKRQERKDGLDQLKSYMAPTNAEYGIWFNGRDIIYIQSLKKAPFWREIPDIPKNGETLEDVGLYQKRNLVPATEMKTIFDTCHNYIYANEGLLKEKVFNEVLKLIFIKMVDEKGPSQKCEFRITEKELEELEQDKQNDFLSRIEHLFNNVKQTYPDVFPEQSERINLKPLTIGVVVSRLQKYSLMRTSTDVKGTAFQTFVYAHERGERGEFFTPHPIPYLAVKMLNPHEDEPIIDPACGSGGFLVETMKHVFDQIDKTRQHLSETERQGIKAEYARNNIHGIDINSDLTRISKMRMILYDDGHTGIFSANSLDVFAQISQIAWRAGAGNVKPNKFMVLFTNPPFGTKGLVTDKTILKNYKLAHKWKKNKETGIWEIDESKLLDGQVPDILFIERCLEFLREKGRMAIVLPDGILTNAQQYYVREFVKRNARILAVVSLPQETFIPHGAGAKTSLLFLQKLSKAELSQLKETDYEIFMAICERIGFDIRGRVIHKKNTLGQLIDDKGGIVANEDDAAVDTDVDEIIAAFNQFKKQQNFDF
jgi:type I restriction enzyme M protein